MRTTNDQRKANQVKADRELKQATADVARLIFDDLSQRLIEVGGDPLDYFAWTKVGVKGKLIISAGYWENEFEGIYAMHSDREGTFTGAIMINLAMETSNCSLVMVHELAHWLHFSPDYSAQFLRPGGEFPDAFARYGDRDQQTQWHEAVARMVERYYLESIGDDMSRARD